MGKASRAKHQPQISDAAYLARVQRRKCLHCDQPLDWGEGDDLTTPRSWHCRRCTARGRMARKKYPTHAEFMGVVRHAIAYLEKNP